MRLVTWNINGLASLSFPFHINAHHTHRYPTVAASTAAVPADEYEYDETALTDCPASTAASPPSALPRDVSDAGGLTAAASEAATSPHDPSFPAFPARRIPLTDVLVASHDELIGYFQADVVCLQEVKIGRARMDLLAKAVRLPHQPHCPTAGCCQRTLSGVRRQSGSPHCPASSLCFLALLSGFCGRL